MAEKSNLRSRIAIVGSCTALFLLVTLVAAKSLTAVREQAVAPDSPNAERTNQPKTSRTFNVSNSRSAQDLGRSIDREIDEGEFSKARWGIFVMNLRDGGVLYARNADRPIAPASNMKVYTTAVALDLLGADYRWRTSVYAKSAPDKSGAITGDLTLYGRGAADLSSKADKDGSKASLDELADALYQRGVRKVRGDLIGDESYLRGDPLGDGWLWNDVQWYFGAEVSALSIEGNQIEIAVGPSPKAGERAIIKIPGENSYVQLINDTNTVERGTPATIGITRGLSDNSIRVWGNFPLGGRGFTARLAVHRPALWAATLFHKALESRGISVDGKVRAIDAREDSTARTDPDHDIELASVKSKTLGEIARVTNKESINLFAELILRTLGKELGSTAPDPDAKKMGTRGDDGAGVAVIRSWLDKRGIPTEALALHDGSGLSRLDLVTPEATVRLLSSINQAPAAKAFRDSLPVAGRDGTLKFRLRGGAAGKVVAKTGTLTYVNSLSGFATTADDEQVAFSIICNDETESESSTRVIDKIAALLTSYAASPR